MNRDLTALGGLGRRREGFFHRNSAGFKNLAAYFSLASSGFRPALWLSLAGGLIGGGLAFVYPALFEAGATAIADASTESMLFAAAGIITVRLAQNGVSAATEYIANSFTVTANHKTLVSLYDKVLRSSLGTVDRHKRSGELLQKLMDTWRLGDCVFNSILVLASATVQVALTLLVIAVHDPIVGMASVLLLAAFLFLSFHASAKLTVLTDASLGTLASLGGILFEGLQRIVSIKALAAHDVFMRKVSERTNELREKDKSRLRFLFKQRLAVPTISIAIEMLLIALIVYRGTLDALTLAHVLALSYLTVRTFGLANTAVPALQQCRTGSALLDRFGELISIPDEQSEQFGCGAIILTDPPEIEFEEVCFAYGSSEVLTNISFVVPAGTRVALVGPTGAGKSTIMKLLLGLYMPSQGRVLINGMDLRALDLYKYRAQLGIILQSESVFPGTILDNLTLGLARAVSEQDVRTCLSEARLLKRIEKFPEELHAWIKDGVLSGGEQQRLIIARTFLRNARLVLMDEPTSALDVATEAEIGLMLNDRMRSATTITIAHHLSTVMAADIVLVISNGMIAETGTHASLLGERGLYSHLFGKSTIA